MVEKAEVAVAGYRDVEGLEYDVLVDTVEGWAAFKQQARFVPADAPVGSESILVDVEPDRLEQAKLARDHIAEKYPDLAARIDLALLADTIRVCARPREKKAGWDALHALAKQSGIAVGKNADALRVKRLRARASRNPKV
jgi:hypothetical protein